ncbi:MAG: ABC transporter permease [Hyphomicrobium sp.]|uniref:ABC transporter permease n=1 Tax=Hyphomicrobium sp. TaxID=82 RepID=UPI0039E40CEA
MKSVPRPGILLVATRELRWMRRDGVALFLVLGVPLIAFTLLAFTFSSAVIRNLQVTIVDSDRTPTSMNYIQAIASAPGVRVANSADGLNDAMKDIRSGRSLAAVFLPENFERDLMGRKRPQIVVFYNRQYFTPGNNANSALTSAISAATAGLPSPVVGRATSFEPGSLVLEKYVLTNPALNYAQFLLRAILPTVLHVITAIAAGYAVGSEFSSRSMAEWMRAAGGSPLTALIGKLLPLFGIFVLMMVVVAIIIHGTFHVAFRGDPIIMGAAACLLVISYLAMGALFALLVRNLPLGLSLTAIFCSPAFGFAGVGFPVLAMNGFAKMWGAILPLRWYIEILFDQAVRGLPPSESVKPFAILGLLAVMFLMLGWWRLSAIRDAKVPKEDASGEDADVSMAPGIGGAMFDEIRRVLNDRGVLGLIVLAPVVYGVLYPQPYLGQLLRGLPIAVVDQDHTELSRRFIQALNDDEATQVAVSADTIADARAALAKRQVYGIVTIPRDTEKEVLRGNSARIGTYVDAAYFLVYSRILQGISEATGVLNQDIATRGARLDGSLAHAGIIKVSPVEALSEPLFNPTGGYASYVVPAAFLLIIQQTLLMGSATLGGVANEQGGISARRRRGGFRAVIGQSLAHLCLVLPALALYLIVLPRVYGFAYSNRVLDLLLMAIPFALSVSLLGQFAGSWFKRRETAVVLFIATSLPLFFLVGVAWPREAIPPVLQSFSFVFPSTSAIDGLVRINQMGATLNEVSSDWLHLWLLVAVYAALTAISGWLLGRRSAKLANGGP